MKCPGLCGRERGAHLPRRSSGMVRAEEGIYLLQPPQHWGHESLLSWYRWSVFGLSILSLSQSSGLLQPGFK